MFDYVVRGAALLDDPEHLAFLLAVRDECEADPDDPSAEFEMSGLPVEDPLAEIARYARATAMFQGTQLRATADFVHARMAAAALEEPAPGRPGDEPAQLAAQSAAQSAAAQSAEAEITLALGVSAPAGSAWVHLALDLARRLPRTLAALESGRITLACSRVLLEETENLTIAQAARVEAEVLPKAAGRTPGSLRTMTRRRVLAIDADAVWKRRCKEVQQRDVTLCHSSDAMAYVGAYLSAEDAVAVFGVIDSFAHAAAGPGDERPIGARRADALVDLILRPGTQDPRVKYVVHLHAPENGGTVGGEGVGGLTGHGPIPAQLVRELAAPATQVTATQVTATQVTATQVTATQVTTAAANACAHADLDSHPDRYEPSTRLAAAVRARDSHCRFPGCRVPAWRCDLDHVIAFKIGGRTIYLNLAAACRRHHRVKHLPGWDVRMGPGGVLTWTTPSGRVYITHPPRPTADDSPEMAEIHAAAPPDQDDDIPPF